MDSRQDIGINPYPRDQRNQILVTGLLSSDIRLAPAAEGKRFDTTALLYLKQFYRSSKWNWWCLSIAGWKDEVVDAVSDLYMGDLIMVLGGSCVPPRTSTKPPAWLGTDQVPALIQAAPHEIYVCDSLPEATKAQVAWEHRDNVQPKSA